VAKLEDVLRLLALESADDLPELLRALGRNKKKSDDALVLQMAIDNRAAAPASAANEYTKLTLSTHVIDLFHSYAWAATGELVTDGITLFNITFASKASARAIALRVTKLVAVESGSSAMS
jgi:ABC-type phosphate transport system permease subunit